jgi:CBS domain-containing protein
MYGLPIRKVLETRKLVTAAPEMSICKAAKLMALRKVGAVAVVDDEQRLVGIFTERDMVVRVVAMERDLETTALAQVMTPAPKTATPDQTFGYALLLMQKNGFRHLPVVEDGKLVGVLSSRSALDPELEEFAAESQRRERIQRESN